MDENELLGVGEKLGEGGQGKVYASEYYGKDVAVKMQSIEHGVFEIKDLLYSFDHINVVKDIGYYLEITKRKKTIKTVYFIMERATSGSLDQIDKSVYLPLIYDIASDLINALVYLEKYEIFHGDICPQNVLIK